MEKFTAPFLYWEEREIMKRRNRVKYICLLIICLFLVFSFWQNNALVVSEYVFETDGIGKGLDGYKIVQISDLHNKRFGKNQKRLVEKIRECEPDIIVVTGDLVDSNHTDVDKAMEFIRGAVKLAPVYYVTGNHEKWLEEQEEADLLKQLEQEGVICLNNKTEKIMVEDDGFLLLGLDDSNLMDGTLKEMASGIEEQFTVLLAHEPQNLIQYSTSHINLVLSGHAHGGQVRLPFIGGVVAPDQGFFPEYTEGLYEKNGTSMIVSRGLGNSIIPVRIFNRPEIVCIEMKKKR